MLGAIQRLPKRLRLAKAQNLARLSHAPGGTRERNRIARGEPLPEAIARAKQDARGEVLREGVTYSAAHTDGQTWQIVRSLAGRTNQVDVILGNQTKQISGYRTIKRAMKRAKL
jgi:hypothetical protein